MQCSQPFEATSTERRKREANDPLVGWIGPALHEPCLLRTVDQADGAVVPQLQMLRDVTDGRGLPVCVTADGEQQLVLGRSQSGRGRLLLAPMQEPSKTVAELEQLLVVGITERHIVLRYVDPAPGVRYPQP